MKLLSTTELSKRTGIPVWSLQRLAKKGLLQVTRKKVGAREIPRKGYFLYFTEDQVEAALALKPELNKGEYLTTKQVARELGFSLYHVQRLEKQGKLNAVRNELNGYRMFPKKEALEAIQKLKQKNNS